MLVRRDPRLVQMFQIAVVGVHWLVVDVAGSALHGRHVAGLEPLDVSGPVHVAGSELPDALDDCLKFVHQDYRDCCDELRSREGLALEPGDLRHYGVTTR